MRRGLPDGIIKEHAAAGDAAMELHGDEAGLALEVGGVISPRREELLHVLWVDRERIDENDRAPCVRELLGVVGAALTTV